MNVNKIIFTFFILFSFGVLKSSAQTYEYYVKEAKVGSITDNLYRDTDNTLKYKGNDKKIKEFFETYSIYKFETAFPSAPKDWTKVVDVITLTSDSNKIEEGIRKSVGNALLLLEFRGEVKKDENVLCYYPNDYGVTGGANTGLPVDVSYYDYTEVPDAWDITTGDPNVIIGISDGDVHENDVEFAGKTVDLTPNNNTSSSHGNGVAAIAAAQGDNGAGTVGVGYDCSMVTIYFESSGTLGYENLIQLHQQGARVINCSWAGPETGYSAYHQYIINQITAAGTVIVGASGNYDQENNNYNIRYPAAYDNVISVGGVGYINDFDCSNVYTTAAGNPAMSNVKDVVGLSLGFSNNTADCSEPLENQAFIYEVSTGVLNEKVDLVAPAGNIFRYGRYLETGNLEYSQFNGVRTSSSAPQVTGAVGLMYSLNECLSFGEIESILKITSKYIGDVGPNAAYENKYGSGTLNTGKAVKLTHNLMTPLSNAYLENQKFNRWDFVFEGVSRNIIMRNQEFTGSSRVHVTGKNAIKLEPGTLLEPNANGEAEFVIDPNLNLTDHCITPTIMPSPRASNKQTEEQALYQMLPTLVENEIKLENKISKKPLISKISIHNLFGRKVFNKDNIGTSDITLQVSQLVPGIYILKGYCKTGEEIFTSKFVKQ
ncbi:S8 family serine peptidase [uncultured Kordia sp.]|uniref:S8 family serine peptidase n=1 Tax=uncultured Kordia sp. TaxID=507699 RepID=UPI0026182C3F|nr:S8 family serine peptidase [uncultured Kordia sp.]